MEGSRGHIMGGTAKVGHSPAGSHATPHPGASPDKQGALASTGGVNARTGARTAGSLGDRGVARLTQSQVAPKTP